MIRCFVLLFLCATPLSADTVVAARTIPAKSLIEVSDLLINNSTIPGTISDPAAIVGMEARVALYAGRPIRRADIGAPAVIERNQIIALHYSAHGVTIATEGRALGRAGPGDVVRVMNLSSRATVMARVGTDGIAYVQ